MIVGCVLIAAVQPASAVKTKAKPAKKVSTQTTKPTVGFNAKGSLDTAIQVQAANSLFAGLPATLVSGMVIRVTGGTRSQTEVSASWTDEQILAWVGLQKTFSLKFVFVINGNDTPQNQLAFVKRWQKAGAQFAFLEMMNEYYLPKYRTGDTSFDEVTRSVSAKQYATEILPVWFQTLDELRLPYFVIGAPVKAGSSGASLVSWNKVMVEAIQGPFRSRRLGITIHLYTDGSGSFDYLQVETLRKQLPEGTPIAITEAGILNIDDESRMAIATRDHLTKILQVLKPGDFLLDQILYKDKGAGLEGTLGPDGLTTKGKAVVEVFLK